jgi:hypothetical protein
MNCLTLKCPSCSEALRYDSQTELFECESCRISLDPMRDIFYPLLRKFVAEKGAFTREAELLTSKLEKCKVTKHVY